MADTTRRGVLTTAVAIGVTEVLPYVRPATASCHPDTAVLALREPYERTLAAADLLSRPHSQAETRYFDLCKAHPDRPAQSIRKESGLALSERKYNRALDANSAVIDQIADAPARTVEGIIFKAKVSERESHTHLDLVESVMRDILKLKEA